MTRTITLPVIHAPTATAHAIGLVNSELKKALAAGATFGDSATVEIGTLPFQVSLDSRGRRLLAPRFGSSPISYVDDCSYAVELVAAQSSVVRSYGVKPKPCSCVQTASVVKDLFECDDWTLSRVRGAKGTRSGWTIGAHDSRRDPARSDDVHEVRLWELLCRKPAIGPYLELPRGWGVMFEGDQVYVLEDGFQAVPVDGPAAYR